MGFNSGFKGLKAARAFGKTELSETQQPTTQECQRAGRI